jgi:hypothetical protein
MSQRVLHYATDQMYYECNQEFRSEDGFHARERCNGLLPGSVPTFDGLAGGSRHSEDHTSWNLLVQEYTWRQMTMANDKLPALSGLAQMFAARIKTNYVAGLWSDAIIEGLAWDALGAYEAPLPAPSAQYIAPSWSWASYSGATATAGAGWTDVATVLDYHTSPEGSSPFGRLTDAWLRVRAPLIPLRISDVPSNKAYSPARIRLRTPWGDPAGAYARFDYVHKHDEAVLRSLMPLSALVLSEMTNKSGNFTCQALIVSPCRDGKPGMRRLGSILLSSGLIENCGAIDDPGRFTTVTLF